MHRNRSRDRHVAAGDDEFGTALDPVEKTTPLLLRFHVIGGGHRGFVNVETGRFAARLTKALV